MPPVHGEERIDEFDWLRDYSDVAVQEHVAAENAYTAASTAHLTPLVEQIARATRTRLGREDLSVPEVVRHQGTSWERSYWYYLRIVEESAAPRFSRLPVDGMTIPNPWAGPADEELLLDVEREAGSSPFFRLGTMRVSPDGRLLAWLADRQGTERFELTVTDLATGVPLDGPIHDVGPTLAWAGARQLFYTRLNARRRASTVMRHRIGTGSADDDVVVHDERDHEAFRVGVKASRDGGWVLINLTSPDSSEVRRVSTDEPEAPPTLVAPRRPGLKYQVEPAGDRLLILHNANGADYELAQAPLECSREAQWRTLVPHRAGRRLQRADAYSEFIVLSLRDEGSSCLEVLRRRPTGDPVEPVGVELPERVGSVLVSQAPNYTDTQIRLMITTFVSPPTVYTYHLHTGQLRQAKTMAVRSVDGESAYDPANYRQERLWALAEDGQRIPISVVRRRDTPPASPTILYGYGAYERSIDPSFDPVRLAALDRGFVFAVAHVRGGGEMGRQWYRDGSTDQKLNTFSDFVACARHLVDVGIADPDRMAAEGSSAGGLLVGVVANTHPDLFRAIVADVPFVDALTTELDPSIPLTVKDWEEFGDPLHDPGIYRLMKSYSPYENVHAGRYPAILATASVSDRRVSFAEPLKWLARIRRTAGVDPQRPRLARVEVFGGHAGATDLTGMTDAASFRMAWVMDQIAPELAWAGLRDADDDVADNADS